MLEFNIKDVPFLDPSSVISFLDETLSSLSFGFNGDYVKSLFLVLLLLYGVGYTIISGIVFYHWNTYGMKTQAILFAKLLFTVVSLGIYIILFSLTLLL